MDRNYPLARGTQVEATRDGKKINSRVYDVKSSFNDKKGKFDNVYTLYNQVGTFTEVRSV